MAQAASTREFVIPQMPNFSSLDEERTYRKQRLAAAFRLFALFGFDEGVAGHITARDPELARPLLGQPVRHVLRAHPGLSDLICVNHLARSSRATGRSTPPPSPSTRRSTRPGPTWSPRRTHTRRHGKAWSSLGRPLDPITQDACAFFEDHALLRRLHRRGARPRGGQAHRRTPSATHKAVILRNHGLLTVGHSVDEAAWWFITMERSCQAQLARRGRRHAGAHRRGQRACPRTTSGRLALAGWFSFQPLYDRIVREQPDLLD